MMQIIATCPSTPLLPAIAQNAGLDVDVQIPKGLGSGGRSMLRTLVMLAEENLSYELWLWSSATHGATIDTDAWLSRWTFVASDAVQETGDTYYRYVIQNLDFPYEDDDASSSPNPARLHITLIPRLAAKTINKKIVIKFFLQPEAAWA